MHRSRIYIYIYTYVYMYIYPDVAKKRAKGDLKIDTCQPKVNRATSRCCYTLDEGRCALDVSRGVTKLRGVLSLKFVI